MNRKAKKIILAKIVVLGDSGVGKTTLMHRYINHTFIETHKATIGADILTKEVELEDVIVVLQVKYDYIQVILLMNVCNKILLSKDMGYGRTRKISIIFNTFMPWCQWMYFSV